MESLGQERRQSLHHGKHNDRDIKEGYVERSIQGRTRYPKSGGGKE